MAGDDSQDEEVRRAIAASLKNPEARENSDGVVDLTCDSDDEEPRGYSPIQSEEVEEEDEDLRMAIKMSLENGGNYSPETPREVKKSAQSPKEQSNSGSTRAQYGIPGLDRKKQEAERLARHAKKRKATVSPPPVERELKVSKPAPSAKTAGDRPVETPSRSEKPKLQSQSRLERNGKTLNSPHRPKSDPALKFWTGTVKKTWAYGYPRDNDIKIEEVFQQSDLQRVVLSSFQWDMDWLFTKFDRTRTKCTLVMQAKDDVTKRIYESDAASLGDVELCFPPMEGQVNCMHSKLMLLFYSNRLRIAVPSANLVPYDWGEPGVMENSIFLIDLPQKPKPEENGNSTNFYNDLVYFLRASTLDDMIISMLSSFDFSQTANIGFVHTIGGSHTGVSWGRTGLCGLGRTVKLMGLKTTQPLKIDFVASSIGSLTDEFLRSMYLASQGDDGLTELTLRNSKTFPAKRINDSSTTVSKDAGSEWKNLFRVYFPSKKTVVESRGGPGAAGTICLQSKWFDGVKFPKQILRDCTSRRPRILMHNKMLFVRPGEKLRLPDGSDCTAWAYVGSANLSESAWGRLVIDRSTKQPKLNCRNWECGVLLPVSKVDNTDSGKGTNLGTSDEPKSIGSSKVPRENTDDDIDIAKIFGGIVPVPMEVPAPSLGPQDRPWFSHEY